MTRPSYSKEKIYNLLPSIYRIKDKEHGQILEKLLGIISEQVEFVEQDIEQLYNNWFIETCDEWIVPYIGDLLGTKILNSVTKSTSNHRSWVANTISYRRRKGTIGILGQLSRDVTGWHCTVVEFFHNLITTQNLNHLRIKSLATLDLRDTTTLESIDTPFDTSTHTADVRHIDSKKGFYNIPNIGLFLWRLQAYPVAHAPAFSFGDGKYSFSQLGHDISLYNYPQTDTNNCDIAGELKVPSKIRRTGLEKSLLIYKEGGSFSYKNSIKILKTVLINGELIESEVLPENILVCNLTNWQHRPPAQKVAVDPELGRIVFPESEEISNVHVSYYYGFSGEIGGGFYDRNKLEKIKLIEAKEQFHFYKINKRKAGTPFDTLSSALEQWKNSEFHDSKDVIFEVTDSEIYSDETNEYPLEIEIPQNISVVIRSQNRQRPIFRLKKPIIIKGHPGSRIIFEGTLFALIEKSSEISDSVFYDSDNTILKIANGDLSELIINHCTFVPSRKQQDIGRLLFTWENIPGTQADTDRLKRFLFDLLNEEWILKNGVVVNKEGVDNNKIRISLNTSTFPSILLEMNSSKDTISVTTAQHDTEEYQLVSNLPLLETNGKLNIYSSTYGISIFEYGIETKNNLLNIFVQNSIMGRIDTWSSKAAIKIKDCIIDGKGVIDAVRANSASIGNTTIFGKLSLEAIELASNSIFTDLVSIERRQQGCIRFCYIPNHSVTPRPYRCILEYESTSAASSASTTHLSETEMATMKYQRIRPQFTSIYFGNDGYAQLQNNVEKIFEADNNSEMGAFNHLYNPQRIKNLLIILDEYLKFGLEGGVFFAT